MNYEKIIAEKDAQIASLTHQLEQLKTLIFGQKRERFKSNIPDEQLNLFVLPEAEQVEDPAIEKITYERKKSTNHPGRSPLPDHLLLKSILSSPKWILKGWLRLEKRLPKRWTILQPAL